VFYVTLYFLRILDGPSRYNKFTIKMFLVCHHTSRKWIKKGWAHHRLTGGLP
jgi:hypothetical protein